MDSFPLLTLPPDTLQKLLNRFQVGELFQLSQCSQKASNTVKTYSSSFDEMAFIFWFRTGTYHEIVMYRSDYSSSLGFTFYGERDPKRLNLRFPKTYNIDGQSIDFCKEGVGRSRYGCATPHSAADFFKFTHYLKTLFNADLDTLHLTINDDSLKVTLMSEWVLKSQNLLICAGGVTHEEMVQMLEYFNGIKQLNLYCSPGQYFSYDKTISANNLWVNNAIWIKRHNLLKFDCEFVSIRDCHLKNEDLNAFLSHWLESGDNKLKFMIIPGEYCFSEEKKENAYKFVQEEVLKGLPTIPGAPKRQDAIRAFPYHHGEIPFETGMDLRRESDGVLATVVVRDEGFHKVTFTFTVWQEPNPNVVVIVP